MDIQTLKYIYDVAIYGSITRAAQYNYISPSHLSRQVKKIEEMLDIISGELMPEIPLPRLSPRT